jgi:SAM-dependent methyltransferase
MSGKKPWYEDETFWMETMPILFSEGRVKEAERESPRLELVQEDMRKFRRADSYDAVINLFTSFGYFEDHRDDQRVVDNVYASLRPGGSPYDEKADRLVVVARKR